MPEATIVPLDQQDEVYKYVRRTWQDVGLDNFIHTPAKNEDMCSTLVNVLPPMTKVIQRRFGYATFIPTLDTGIASGSDNIPLSALYGTGFDGETGYVYTSKSFTQANNPTFSVELWFETGSTSGGYLFSINNNSQINAGTDVEYFGIYMNAAGNIGVGLSNGSSVALSALTPLAYNDSIGHMLDVTISGGTVLIYVDSVLVVTSSVTTHTGSEAAYIRLAQGPGGAGWPSTIDEYYQGFLSHVSYFPFVLTQTQINTTYQAMTNLGGTQSLYEAAVSAEAPTYFWKLTETATAVPPSKSIIVQTAKGTFAGATGTVTFPLPVTVGHLILVTIGSSGSLTTAVTDNESNPYTEVLSSIAAAGSSFNMSFWTATASQTGTLTIEMTNPPGSKGSETQFIIAQELQNATLPTDGANISNFVSPTGSSPAITTADSPDFILAYVFTDSSSIMPVPGNGFTTTSTISGTSSFDSLTHTLLSAYEQTNAIGTFGCTWIQSGSHRAITATVGIPITIPVTTPGNNAYDSADSNNGMYSIVSQPNSISNNTYTQAGPVVTYTATASTEDILIGDTAILMLTINGSSPSIVSITDSDSNTWASQSPNGLDFASGADLFQIWTTNATVQHPIGSFFTITITLSAGAMPTQISFANYPGLAVVQTSAHATVTSASTISSGGVTVNFTPAVAIAFAATQSTFSSTPAAPFGTPFMGVAAHNGTSASATNAYISSNGTYTDSWTFAGTSSGADVLIVWNATGGFFLGQYIIVA